MLVERATGGKGGGGAVLTIWPASDQLLRFAGPNSAKAFDVLSDDDALPLTVCWPLSPAFHCKPAPEIGGSAPLPPAIARRVQQHVDVLLADGAKRGSSRADGASGERLGFGGR